MPCEQTLDLKISLPLCIMMHKFNTTHMNPMPEGCLQLLGMSFEADVCTASATPNTYQATQVETG